MRVAVIAVVVMLVVFVAAHDEFEKRSTGWCRCFSVFYKLLWHKLILLKDLYNCKAVKNGEKDDSTPQTDLDQIRQIIADSQACCGSKWWFRKFVYAINTLIDLVTHCHDCLTTTTTTTTATTATTTDSSDLECQAHVGGSCLFEVCPGTLRPDAVCSTQYTCCVLTAVQRAALNVTEY